MGIIAFFKGVVFSPIFKIQVCWSFLNCPFFCFHLHGHEFLYLYSCRLASCLKNCSCNCDLKQPWTALELSTYDKGSKTLKNTSTDKRLSYVTEMAASDRRGKQIKSRNAQQTGY